MAYVPLALPSLPTHSQISAFVLQIMVYLLWPSRAEAYFKVRISYFYARAYGDHSSSLLSGQLVPPDVQEAAVPYETVDPEAGRNSGL